MKRMFEKILIVERFTVVRLVELFRRQNFRGAKP